MARPSSCAALQAGAVAVVTGASSGIGKAAALKFAKMGLKVCLADNDQAELVKACEEVKRVAEAGADSVLACEVDVAKKDSLDALKAKVLEKYGAAPGVLMNNAGVGLGGGALVKRDEWEKTLNINLWGVINGCQAFVSDMMAAKQPGLVITTGSKQGITMPPGNLAYNVSKAAVKAYAEGLEHELRSTEGSQVRSCLLVPGWTNTSILRKAKRSREGDSYDESTVFFWEGKPQAGAWSAEQVVEFMLESLKKDQFYIICPDNDVTEDVDNKRMRWTGSDIPERRPPLSRWHPDYKVAFEAFMAQE